MTEDSSAEYELEPPSPPTPSESSAAPGAPGTPADPDADVFCIQCGYSLRGLDAQGNCPECGTPVERSMRGNLLIHSAPDYLKQLHQGVFLIQASIALSFVFTILTIVVSFFTAFGMGGGGGGGGAGGAMVPGAGGTAATVVLEWATSLTSIIGLWGWWLFSSPDPAFSGRDDGSQARQVVRITLVINAVVFFVSAVGSSVYFGNAHPILVTLGLLSAVVWAVSFFASMLYLRWLTPRVPHEKAYKRAKTLMWLGPLLFIVGAACFMLGPLVALVLYWNMLDWIRRDLKDLRVAVEADWSGPVAT